MHKIPRDRMTALVLLCGLMDEIDRSREMGGTATGRRTAGNLAGTAADRWRARLGHYLPLIERIPVLLCA